MTALYNEIDPYCAQWLRNLIDAGHIAPGVVDERSIEDITPNELRGYTQCHFFAGIGVWSYALRLAGWPDDRPVWTGSCPCQPFSSAGKGAGFADERHLWPAWFHLIRECRPGVIFGEQVEAAIAHGWLDLVQDDLEGEGYACGPCCFPSASLGAADIRSRLWLVAANSDEPGLERPDEHGNNTQKDGALAWRELARVHAEAAWPQWVSESGAGALVDGAPNRVGRLRAYGNAINAEAAAAVIRAYMESRQVLAARIAA